LLATLSTSACDCGDDDDTMGDGDADADGDGDGDGDADGDADACDPVENPPAPDPDACGEPESRQIAEASDLPGSTTGDALAGLGDWLLGNDRIRYYIDDVGNANGIAPTGGTLIDILPEGQTVDHFNQLASIFFLEQGNFLAYDAIETGQEDGSAWIEVRGTIRGGPQGDFGGVLEATTRYELRRCETALRIWTDVTNVSDAPVSGGLGTVVTDTILWGTRGMQPFCAAEGQGYACPGFDAANPLGSVAELPYLGAAAPLEGPFSLAIVALNQPNLFGVNDEQVSAVGASDALGAALSAGGTRTYGRALLVSTTRNDVASASDLAFAGRARCAGQEVGTACLAVDAGMLPFPAGDPRNGGVLFYQGGQDDPHDPETRVAMTHSRFSETGGLSALLPVGTYYWELTGPGGGVSHGGPLEVTAGGDACTDAGVAAAANLSIELVDGTGAAIPGRVIVRGTGDTPDPVMGPARGGSPALNVALVDETGLVDLWLVPGTYHVFATAGLEHSLAEADVTLDAAGADLRLTVDRVLDTPGWLSADMHVHSVLSFDSSLPLDDRVLAYVAEGVDVVVATEHDVVGDYGPTIAALGYDGRIVGIPGLESTGNVISGDFPHTIGHHNAWPLDPDPAAPRAGAPPDEGIDIETLYERLRGAGAEIVQLNHGRSSTVGSLWLGWLDACEFDPTQPVDAAPGCDLGRWDLMEVMNGSSVPTNQANRGDWFSLLSQLPFIPGTANSDSHKMVLEEAGYPRNYVAMNDDLATFDVATFDEAVAAGRMFGTNGPILEVQAWSSARPGEPQGPGGLLRVDDGDTLVLGVRVRAVPWIPVDELVVTANGVEIANETALAVDEVVRFDGEIDLGPIAEDTWIVVEAGTPWPADGGDPPASPEPLASVAPGTVPHAFTNPIFVSGDGDDAFTPPGL
jgi:hypothetical protein